MNKSRLDKFYEKVVAEDFILLYNFTNLSRIPKFESAVLSSTSSLFGKSKISAAQSFSVWRLQTSQKCKDTRARNSIAFGNFRKGTLLGIKTTLRKKALFRLLDKALLFILPKIESFGITYTSKAGKIPFTRYRSRSFNQTFDFLPHSSLFRDALVNATLGGSKENSERVNKDFDNKIDTNEISVVQGSLEGKSLQRKISLSGAKTHKNSIVESTGNPKKFLNKLPTFLNLHREKSFNTCNVIAASSHSHERINNVKIKGRIERTSFEDNQFNVKGFKQQNFSHRSSFLFTIGAQSCTFFPESNLLSIFLSSAPGFSLSFCCTEIGPSSFPRFSTKLQQSLHDLVSSAYREEHVKDTFVSAFCFLRRCKQ